MMGPGGHMGGRRASLPDTASYAAAGLGDPSVQARVALLEDRPGPLSLAAVGHVKVPLADASRGFGTGAWDIGAGLALSKALGKRFVFLDLTYWWLGDLAELELQNALGYSAAFGQPLFGGKLAALLSISGYTEILDGVAPPVQAGLGLTYWLRGGHGLSATAAFGLTEATPDLSFGVGWRVAL